VLALVRPFFPNGWHLLPDVVSTAEAADLAYLAGFALAEIQSLEQACTAFCAASRGRMIDGNCRQAVMIFSSISGTVRDHGDPAKAERICLLNLELAEMLEGGQNGSSLTDARIDYFSQLAATGRWEEAENLWRVIESDSNELRDFKQCHPGYLEWLYANLRFLRGDLTEEHLATAEQLTRSVKTQHLHSRCLFRMRGVWHLDREEYPEARDSLQHAARMAREVGHVDADAETYLTLAKYHLGLIDNPKREAERLSAATSRSFYALADLWLALGERAQATRFALMAFEWAWASGEPFVFRFWLNRAKDCLRRLNVATPTLRRYDPVHEKRPVWDDVLTVLAHDLRGAICAVITGSRAGVYRKRIEANLPP
jgi:hypothetical protein